jgi:hypothetical protein
MSGSAVESGSPAAPEPETADAAVPSGVSASLFTAASASGLVAPPDAVGFAGLMIVGDDGAVCVDGVCSIPARPATQASSR